MWLTVGVDVSRTAVKSPESKSFCEVDVWSGMDEDDKAMISELMASHVDSTIDQYVSGEFKFLEEVKKTGIEIKPDGPEFFGEKIEAWNGIWQNKSL